PSEFMTRSPGHYRDWIRACKGGDPACSNFSVAGPFTEWISLGVLALRFEGKLEWDSEKMRITNNAEANKLIKPAFRKGWTHGKDSATSQPELRRANRALTSRLLRPTLPSACTV